MPSRIGCARNTASAQSQTARLAAMSRLHPPGIIRLTYHDLPIDKAEDRPAHEPTDEIEVTPEMVEAGIGAMSKWSDYDEMAEDVYVAMERVRRRGAHDGAPAPSRGPPQTRS